MEMETPVTKNNAPIKCVTEQVGETQYKEDNLERAPCVTVCRATNDNIPTDLDIDTTSTDAVYLRVSVPIVAYNGVKGGGDATYLRITNRQWPEKFLAKVLDERYANDGFAMILILQVNSAARRLVERLLSNDEDSNNDMCYLIPPVSQVTRYALAMHLVIVEEDLKRALPREGEIKAPETIDMPEAQETMQVCATAEEAATAITTVVSSDPVEESAPLSSEKQLDQTDIPEPPSKPEPSCYDNPEQELSPMECQVVDEVTEEVNETLDETMSYDENCALCALNSITDSFNDILSVTDKIGRSSPLGEDEDSIKNRLNASIRRRRKAVGDFLFREADEPKPPNRKPKILSSTLEKAKKLLDNGQREVADLLFEGERLICCFAPPGSGKSYTIALAAVLYFLENTDHHILILAPTNVAANVLMENVIKCFKKLTGKVPDKSVIRYARSEYSATELGDLYDYSTTAISDSFGSSEGCKLSPRIFEYGIVVQTVDLAIMSNLNTVQTIDDEGTSIYDLVILDEAACVSYPQTMWMMTLGIDGQIVLLGDTNQLPSFILSMKVKANAGDESGMAAVIRKCHYNQCGKIVQFSNNYRSTNAIVAPSNYVMYRDNPLTMVNDEKLHAEIEKHNNYTKGNLKQYLLPGKPVGISCIHVEGTMRFHGSSRYNADELYVLRTVVQTLRWLDVPLNQVGIDCMYAAQAALAKAMLACYPEIKIGCTNTWQGNERPFMIITMVLSNPHESLDTYGMGNEAGFLGDLRRVNVALTRAQNSTIIISNTLHFVNHALLGEVYREACNNSSWVHFPSDINPNTGMERNTRITTPPAVKCYVHYAICECWPGSSVGTTDPGDDFEGLQVALVDPDSYSCLDHATPEMEVDHSWQPATAGQVADLTEKIEAFFGMDDDRSGSDGDETSGDDTSNPLYSTIVAKKLAPPVPSKFVHNLRAIDESDRKRRCVVVSGLPENGTDRDDVLHLVQSLDRSAEVADFFRMGRLEAPTAGGVQKPRLMKVCFSASDVARSVLSQARLLKTVPALSAQYKDVFIRRSMTREERDYLYKLRMERNRLNTANDTATTEIETQRPIKPCVRSCYDQSGVLRETTDTEQTTYEPIRTFCLSKFPKFPMERLNDTTPEGNRLKHVTSDKRPENNGFILKTERRNTTESQWTHRRQPTSIRTNDDRRNQVTTDKNKGSTQATHQKDQFNDQWSHEKRPTSLHTNDKCPNVASNRIRHQRPTKEDRKHAVPANTNRRSNHWNQSTIGTKFVAMKQNYQTPTKPMPKLQTQETNLKTGVAID